MRKRPSRPPLRPRIGAHVSISGGMEKALERARAAGCDALQVFVRNPRGWRVAFIPDEELEEFRRRRLASGLAPLVVHCPYLINLSAADPVVFRKSCDSFRDDLRRSRLLGAEAYVIHVGFHLGQGREAGIGKMAQALAGAAGDYPGPLPAILLENTASAGSSLGQRFEEIAEIIEKSRVPDRLGLCLDTCHAFVAGYNLADPEGLEKTLREIDRLIGLKRLELVHFNDSVYGLGSRRDRHAHIGEGAIGAAGMRRILLHPLLADKTFILETPKTTPDADVRNLDLVRAWRAGG